MSKADKIEAVFSGAEEVLVGVREKIGKIAYDFNNEGQYVRFRRLAIGRVRVFQRSCER